MGSSLESVHASHQDVEKYDGELVAKQCLERGVPGTAPAPASD